MAAVSSGSRGATLIESLVALLILGIAAAGVLPAFMTQLDANGRNELRSASILVARQTMESLRVLDPATEIPDAGHSATRLVTVGDRPYEVVEYYCERNEYCDDISRHIRVEVSFEGQLIYDVETVYTQLKPAAP